MDDIFLTRTADEWMRALKDSGDIICTPLQTIRDLPEDPQVLANDYIVQREHSALGSVRVRGLPVELNRTPGQVTVEAPEFGQHTEEILLEAGYSWEDIAALREKQAI